MLLFHHGRNYKRGYKTEWQEMEKEEQMRQIHATPRPVSYHLMYERGLVLHHIVWTV